MDDILGRKTLIAFREYLVGWTLRQISDEFEGAYITRDQEYNPDLPGQRRTLVEQFYHTLDITNPNDVHKLIKVFESILQQEEQRLQATSDNDDADKQTINKLMTYLKKDGFGYEDKTIIPLTPKMKTIFKDPKPMHKITEVTRRAIFENICEMGVSWAGSLSEEQFLSELYDLSSFPSGDPRFDTLLEDLWQHRDYNQDWPDNWVFTDSRLGLLQDTDDAFMNFLCHVVHPLARPDSSKSNEIVAMFNSHLRIDGWQLSQGRPISGRPTFVAVNCSTADIVLPENNQAADVLSEEYLQELSNKCDARLDSKDYDGAVTVSRTYLEAVLVELQIRLSGTKNDHGGHLPTQFKDVAKMLHMDDTRKDLDDRFKDVVRGLVAVVGGIAPLRNKISDGHARERRPAPHHARLVVNSAKTIATFLVESYCYQRDKDKIKSPLKTGSSSPLPQ